MFRHILVSFDGNRRAERALSRAIDIARADRSRLTILTAVPKPPPWCGASLTVATPLVLEEDLKRECVENLRGAVDRVPDDIPVTKILTREPIRKALRHQLQTEKYDLLVIGRRGPGPLSSLRGGVFRHALRRARIPMLVVAADDAVAGSPAARSPRTGGYLRPRPQ